MCAIVLCFLTFQATDTADGHGGEASAARWRLRGAVVARPSHRRPRQALSPQTGGETMEGGRH